MIHNDDNADANLVIDNFLEGGMHHQVWEKKANEFKSAKWFAQDGARVQKFALSVLIIWFRLRCGFHWFYRYVN